MSSAIEMGRMDPKNTMRRRSAVEGRIVMRARFRRDEIVELAMIVKMKMLFLCMMVCERERQERERE